ncbi:PhnE/PtxC family ABC transporter permease [Haliangium sp.]|uniref:PhnE/PtxC family ABC transporter permease n=1 Tax=Haliangium sp. TaxID=2663208 RepID=UPI003D0F9799
MNAPEPMVPARYRATLSWLGLVLVSLVACAWHSGVDLSALATLWRGGEMGALTDTASGLARPDLSAEYVARVARLAVDSLAIGVLGTALALVLGAALSLVAARWPGLVHGPRRSRAGTVTSAGTRALARALLAGFRAVPEIVWAFLFVRIFGLGPGAAVLAIGVSFAGVLGRLYAELIEAAPAAPARSLAGAGAGRTAVFLYGVFPLVRRQWVAYALFRLECAIRSGAILGVVGAGGLGQEIELSLRYYQFDKLATTLAAVLLLAIALEAASLRLRRSSTGTLSALLGAAVAGSLLWLEVPWGAMFSADALEQARRFLAGFGSPTADLGFWVEAAGEAVVTVAMAWSATLVAAAGALVLAPLAAWTFTVGGYLPAPPGRSGLAGVVRVGLMAVTRLLSQVLRALPELVWALLFIVWVGPGVTAGALAVGVHTLGILARLYGDVLEEAEPAPLVLLEKAGAGRVARYVYGALPQVAPRLVSYGLYRFEVNIRATTMVGFVGAGGLGDALHTSLSLFHMHDLAALIVVLVGTVVLVDALGDRLRARLLG